MDIEAANRRLICSALDGHFDTWEEVPVATGFGKLRIDVVARCRTGDTEGKVLAFEVKSGLQALNYAKWAKAFKQAADYVNGQVELPTFGLTPVTVVFVFPSPPYVTCPSPAFPVTQKLWFRMEELAHYAGVIHLAEYFRVGWAKHSTAFGLSLHMGPNPVWDKRHGWHKSGRDLLFSRRKGSQTARS